MSNQEADVLRCWRCRKYIANSVCLAKCHGKGLSEQTSQPSAATQESCNMWHGNLESIPAWVNCDIEKAQWTIGKLHCPFCEACLGGFVCNTKCSCGQLVNIHFCKSRTDCQPAFSIKLAKSPGKHLPCLKIQSGFSKDTFREAGTATLEIKNQGLSYMTRNNNGTERLTEALSLEVRAPGFEVESEKLPLKALNKKRNLSASCPVNDACTVKHFHRRSRSLDLNIRETLVLSPALYEACSMETIYRSRNENPPIDTSSDLQLESGRKDGSSFQDLCGFSADKLLKRFRVASFSTLVHREAESECDFEATGQSSGSNVADGSPFVMNLSSPTSAVEEEQYITAVGLVQPISISFHQKLSKRERNKLKSLRRKQRRGEWWLQKQTANDNLHTDDEHELRGDKESYLCAVCLDVYFNPYMCYPCHHIFCEPCLRMLAKDNPAHTPCPLCRTTIARVFFQTELNNSTKSFFPMEYLKLKENFQKSNSAKWPLPSCKKAFRVFEVPQQELPKTLAQTHATGVPVDALVKILFDLHALMARIKRRGMAYSNLPEERETSEGFQRRSDTVTRRHFPHAAHRMDYVDFEDDSHGWWFDMDMVIIYIYSVNWVIGFIVFCFLCYFFFPF